VIPTPHRAKGGAPLLGASRDGEPGPFGPYADDNEDYDTVTEVPQPDSEPTVQADIRCH
jgi:hypothetical protein